MIRQLLNIPRLLSVMMAIMAVSVPVGAQQAPGPDAEEPAVNTSRPAPTVEEPQPTGTNGAGAADDAGAPAEAAAAQPQQSTRPADGPRRFRTMDRLELDPSAITGNQELPKVLYIVPWKKAELGDVAGRPSNSLLDEVLTPVDRDVFRRQTEYFSKLESSAAAQQAGAAPAAEGATREQTRGSAAQPPQGKQPGQN
jgi:hypothetical protein